MPKEVNKSKCEIKMSMLYTLHSARRKSVILKDHLEMRNKHLNDNDKASFKLSTVLL